MIKEYILDQCCLSSAFLVAVFSDLFPCVEKNLGGPNFIHTANSCFCVVLPLGFTALARSSSSGCAGTVIKNNYI